jgi:uncharacterized membrane protein HdeD (DUF308 family)
MNIAGFQITSGSRMFLTIVAIHVPVGMVAVVTGVAAMISDKRRGAHTRFGSIYFWSLSVLFITSTGLAAMRCEKTIICSFSVRFLSAWR